MSKSSNNKVVAVLAVFLIGVAVALSALLLMEESEPALPSDSEIPPVEAMSNLPSYNPQNSGGAVQVDSKYLWEYGGQHISSERPNELNTKKETTTYKSVLELFTVIQQVTDANGENVTDEQGNAVTEVGTASNIKYYPEYVTDANGESVTDENGVPVTEMRSEYITRAPEPVYVTDANGENITDENGAFVTEVPTTAPPVEEGPTTAAVGSRPEGANVWAQGMSDGEKYTTMKIYIDGEYDIKSSSVMTLTLREKSGLVNMPDTLTYNLSKGTCSLSPTKKQNDMAYVTQSAGQTIVTLIIPEEARPAVSNTTTFRAKSTLSTFNSGGEYLDEFTVSVNLS